MLRYTKGDTKPDFFFDLERENEALDLTTIQKVEFKLRRPSGVVITRQMSVVGDPALGKLQGAWGVGDLSESGQMYGDVVITWGDGSIEHSETPVRVLVREEFSVQ